MIPLAHVSGMPVEELLPALASTGSSLLVVWAWLSHRLRRERRRQVGR